MLDAYADVTRTLRSDPASKTGIAMEALVRMEVLARTLQEDEEHLTDLAARGDRAPDPELARAAGQMLIIVRAAWAALTSIAEAGRETAKDGHPIATGPRPWTPSENEVFEAQLDCTGERWWRCLAVRNPDARAGSGAQRELGLCVQRLECDMPPLGTVTAMRRLRRGP